MNKKVLNLIYPIITVIAIILLWQVEALKIGTELILPTPLTALKEMIKEFGEKSFWKSISGSLIRILFSFSISLVLAVIIGLLAKLFSPIWKITYPVVAVIRVIPTMAVILLAIIWYSGQKAPIFITLLVSFPLLYYSVYSALNKVDVKLIEVSKVFAIRKKDLLLKLYLPSVCKDVYDDLISVMGLSVKLTISAEALALTKDSIGRLMYMSKANLEVGRLFAFTIVAIVISFALEFLIRLIALIIKKAVRK